MQKYNDCHLYIYKWKPKKERVYIVARAQIGFYLEPRVLNFSIKKKKKKKRRCSEFNPFLFLNREKKKKKRGMVLIRDLVHVSLHQAYNACWGIFDPHGYIVYIWRESWQCMGHIIYPFFQRDWNPEWTPTI